ncbi:flippase [Weissella confusa]|uniref:flippase n=1 Tax=Weissella confusa TaxID=1583 RepID=UPI002E1A2221|nr:flippase [Weissella confusa]
MQIVKNYLYNVGYQLLTVLAPLLTLTYLARVLGKDGMGIQSWTNSIVTYFLLLATLGISLYGQREIAYVRDDAALRAKRFWEIQILHMCVAMVSIVGYLIFVFGMNYTQTDFHVYNYQLLLQTWVILSALLDISWYFMGMEDFKKTVVRNSLVKIAMVVLIFVLVKSSHDINKYILLLALTQVIGNLTMWYYIPHEVGRPQFKGLQIMQHLRPTIALFLPTIATQVYLQLNKTMLPLLPGGTQAASGFYDSADKIVKISLALVTALGTVMLPRIANNFAKGKTEVINQAIYASMDFVAALAMPLMFGMSAISPHMILWFMGKEFAPVGVVIAILTPVVVFIAWSTVLGTQYLMPVKRTREYTTSVVLGAVVNIVLNFVFIPFWEVYGAAMATVISELAVTAYQVIVVRKSLSIYDLFQGQWKYLIAGVVMYAVLTSMTLIQAASPLNTLLQIIVGVIVYVAGIIVLRAKILQTAVAFLKNRKQVKK